MKRQDTHVIRHPDEDRKRAIVSQLSASAKRCIETSEVTDQANRRRRSHIEDAHYIRRGFVYPLSTIPIKTRRQTLFSERHQKLIAQFLSEPLVCSEDGVSGRFMTHCGPGQNIAATMLW